jgi:hypothetical protein
MKKQFPLLYLLVLAFRFSIAQDTLPSRPIVFKTSIRTNQASIGNGYLSILTDSSLVLVKSRMAMDFPFSTQTTIQRFGYGDIQSICLRRPGSTGRGMLGGAFIGLLVGFLSGIVQGDDPSKTYPNFFGNGTITVQGTTAVEKGIMFGMIGSVTGTIVGGLMGTFIHKHYDIHGQKDRFTQMKEEVLARIYNR